jgi:hypothetical protein
MESHPKTIQQTIVTAAITALVPPKEAAIFVFSRRTSKKLTQAAQIISRIIDSIELDTARDDDNTQERLLKTKLRRQTLSHPSFNK